MTGWGKEGMFVMRGGNLMSLWWKRNQIRLSSRIGRTLAIRVMMMIKKDEIWLGHMSTPTRKLPSWHFSYSDIICLQSFVRKDGNFTMFWKWNTVSCMLYFLWGIILLIRIFSTVRYKIMRWSENVRFFHKGGFPMGTLICQKATRKFIKSKVRSFTGGIV